MDANNQAGGQGSIDLHKLIIFTVASLTWNT